MFNPITLSLRNELGHIFELNLRYPITVLCGASSTGKSYVYQLIEQKKKQSKARGVEDIYSSALLFNYSDDTEALLRILQSKGKLIVIDNADLLLIDCDKVRKFINEDRQNTYIIIERGSVGLKVAPTMYADLVLENEDKTVLKYAECIIQ